MLITNCISTESISTLWVWEHHSKIIYWTADLQFPFSKKFGYGSSQDPLAGNLLTKRQFYLNQLTGNSQAQHCFNNSSLPTNLESNNPLKPLPATLQRHPTALRISLQGSKILASKIFQAVKWDFYILNTFSIRQQSCN